MPLAAQILAVLAALTHVFFFYLESIAWTKPSTWKTFGLKSQEEAEITKGLALNQGFYNLFLAIGVIVGVVAESTAFDAKPSTISLMQRFENDGAFSTWGGPFAVFGLACMVGAALVLLISSKGKMARGAAIQGVLPLAALLVIAVF